MSWAPVHVTAAFAVCDVNPPPLLSRPRPRSSATVRSWQDDHESGNTPIGHDQAEHLVHTSSAKSLARFARDGGPDLSDLRGHPTIHRQPSGSISSSRSSRSRASKFIDPATASATSKTSETSETSKSKSKSKPSAYDADFDSHLTNHDVHPVYSSQRPDLAETRDALTVARPSLSPSRISEGAFEAFQDANARAKKEAEVMAYGMPVILGLPTRPLLRWGLTTSSRSRTGRSFSPSQTSTMEQILGSWSGQFATRSVSTLCHRPQRTDPGTQLLGQGKRPQKHTVCSHTTSTLLASRDDDNSRSNTKDLRDFLNASRVTPPSTAEGVNRIESTATGSRFTPIVLPAAAAAAAGVGESDSRVESAGKTAEGSDEIVVGPLLNYRRMDGDHWIGSVLVVTRGGGKTLPAVAPKMVFGPADAADATQPTKTHGICLYSDPRNTFWRFDLSVPLGSTEARWQYSLPDLRFASATKPKTSVFSVPAISESMRILFYSCNGFSVGTDEDAWSGPALWNDVLRHHSKTAFHVMIGGGDQIYNDGIRVSGPLREWTAIGNPKKRREYTFPESLRRKCDDYYLNNYIRWYSTEPFATANGQIAQLNIWDDHDIIDGFGSYVNEFMKCDVFRGIGGSAHKYYMLFQHHLPPPPSTFTSDAPHVGVSQTNGRGVDPTQLLDTYVAPTMVESGYIIGSKPGPYVAEHSHNMYAKLGARMAFLGIDARTERTRHQVNYPETYNQIFDRLDKEFKAAAASGEPVRHLILLLGIPIAYPRLTWLENVFNSPVMGLMKFMNRRFGFGGGFFNYFDGSVDLMDDLDDHYTARTHKKERNEFVERLQTVSAAHSVRITILGGDVHLAALGRFYSNPSLGIAAENDHRFMINVVSSAITNKPPPAVIANLLARRNKIHHLNSSTDETLFRLFDKDPGTATRTASHNQVTMPSRNFAIITENSPHNDAAEGAAGNGSWPRPNTGGGPNGFPPASAHGANGANGPAYLSGGENASMPPSSSTGYSASAISTRSQPGTRSGRCGNGHRPLHAGEEGAGTKHRAAGAAHGQLNDGSLDVSICVEVDQHDREGHTEAYGLTIPALDYTAAPPVPEIPSRFRAGSRPRTA